MIISNLFTIWISAENRERRRIPYREVAAATGLSSATLVAWRKDTVERFDKGTLEKLCDYFGCEVADLIKRRA